MFELSQSKLDDWLTMCPIQCEVKWRHYENEEDNPWYIGDREIVRLGNWYEQQAIGMSRGGKITHLTSKERNGAKGQYAAIQAKNTKEWLRSLDGKIMAVQEEVRSSFERNGITVRLIGHTDVRFQYSNGRQAIIDLKLTGSRDNTFGKFKWGDIQNMDVKQLKQYKLIHLLNWGEEPETKYHVVDVSNTLKVGIFNIIISDITMEAYMDLVTEVYAEIAESYMLGFFKPKNTYDNCSVCPIASTCKYRNDTPDEEDVYF